MHDFLLPIETIIGISFIVLVVLMEVKYRMQRKNHFKIFDRGAPPSTQSAFPPPVKPLSEDERFRLEYAEKALRFLENYIQGLSFETETFQTLMREMERRHHPISSQYIFSNVNLKNVSAPFQLDLVLLTEKRIFVLECKKWNQVSAQKDFFETATTRFLLHSNSLYSYLKKLGLAQDLTRIIVVSQDTANEHIITDGFKESIKYSFKKVEKYYRVTTLQDLPKLLIDLSYHTLCPPSPALRNAVERLASYNVTPVIYH